MLKTLWHKLATASFFIHTFNVWYVGIDIYNDIEGIEHSIKYEEKEAIEEITVDYDKLDYNKAKTVPGIDVSGDTKKGVSLKASEKLLEANGYTKITK
ncbi:DUF1307 domain-containing protein [Vagococcus fluvialis]|uniref:DUF1307 domain-containing protein n=1 Tax=Vagococcus fluvialis TaxID=2738 RepID=UPI001A8DA743|nr:DUF1307 domain-containing protein [Vagococcus fluvialis]UDM81105.1 YehR family protein [Vagococcus fluvialis]